MTPAFVIGNKTDTHFRRLNLALLLDHAFCIKIPLNFAKHPRDSLYYHSLLWFALRKNHGNEAFLGDDWKYGVIPPWLPSLEKTSINLNGSSRSVMALASPLDLQVFEGYTSAMEEGIFRISCVFRPKKLNFSIWKVLLQRHIMLQSIHIYSLNKKYGF